MHSLRDLSLERSSISGSGPHDNEQEGRGGGDSPRGMIQKEQEAVRILAVPHGAGERLSHLPLIGWPPLRKSESGNYRDWMIYKNKYKV